MGNGDWYMSAEELRRCSDSIPTMWDAEVTIPGHVDPFTETVPNFGVATGAL